MNTSFLYREIRQKIFENYEKHENYSDASNVILPINALLIADNFWRQLNKKEKISIDRSYIKSQYGGLPKFGFIKN